MEDDEVTWISGLCGLRGLLDEVEDTIGNLEDVADSDISEMMRISAYAAFRLGIIFNQLSIVDQIGSEEGCELESRETILKLAQNLRQRVDECLLKLGIEKVEEQE